MMLPFSSQFHESALVESGDLPASRILVACHQLKRKIREALPAVGINSSSFYEGTNPPLTSLHQEIERMVFDATIHLQDIIHGDLTERQRWKRLPNFYDCALNVRATIAIPSLRKIQS